MSHLIGVYRNYDVFGASSTPGPNAPLGNLCGSSTEPDYSAQAAHSQWTAAGFPASKLVLGLPLYGYVSDSTMTSLSGSFIDPSAQKVAGLNPLNGAHPRAKISAPKTIVPSPEGAEANLQSWYGQQIPFGSIVAAGALKKDAEGNYNEAGGFTMAWDNCSDSPFLYNTNQATVVTYDGKCTLYLSSH
jgi:chitinase